MKKVLDAIYDYRLADDFDPSKLFHRLVNKRVIPEYYETIKEPMALSTIKKKITGRVYTRFEDYVRDFALIPYNAQVFNRADSGAFQDALVIRDQIEKQLAGLVKEGIVTQEMVKLPDLGEIPTYEEAPLPEVEAEAEDDDDSDDEGEEDDEDEEGEEDGVRKKRKYNRKSLAAKERDAEDGIAGKKNRGRPPKLLTPIEARILAVLKGIRKPKNAQNQLMIKNFDRLPDKQTMPEYFQEIKQPISYDTLKRKVKRKKYREVKDFMVDVNLMFNNALQYNEPGSQIWNEASELQKEGGKLYDQQMRKADDTFVDEDGKVPMPNGILHNGELYKVGDWVHLQNPNDLTKPIPAQIYRTYKNPDGQGMVNVCWYYRPEQTVHRFDKHFLPNEVVKTGRYRDHHVEEIEGRCFIMFLTRYFKGRPRGREGQEIYVCESRYNETLHQFNKIKTWASCLPDEVRDKDYEMDLFDHSRKMKKFPSPIAYMLKDEQKETDELPKVTWGADGAPPKIGAVHRRARGERDSRPPEPTPPPPPKQPTPPPRPTPVQHNTYHQPSAVSTQQQQPTRTPAVRPSYSNSTSSPYHQHTAPSSAPARPPSVQPSQYGSTPQTPLQLQPSVVRAPATTAAPSYNHQSTIPPPPTYGGARPTTATAQSYRDPPPIEVYVLPDQANLSIPSEVREMYQRDEQGRVLFFTAPPVAVEDKSLPGHSVRYLAEKARRQAAQSQDRQKRKLEEQQGERAAKRARLELEESTAGAVEGLKYKAALQLERYLAEGVSVELGGRDGHLAAAQNVAAEQQALVERNAERRVSMKMVRLGGDGGLFNDDRDARVVRA